MQPIASARQRVVKLILGTGSCTNRIRRGESRSQLTCRVERGFDRIGQWQLGTGWAQGCRGHGSLG